MVSCCSSAGLAALGLAFLCQDARAQQQIALFPDVYANASNTGFGVGVAVLSRTGSVLAVSAEFLNINSGGAYVFSCDAGACALSQIITLSSGLPGDLLAHGLALSSDGMTIALGAPGRSVSAGAVFTAACNSGTGVCGTLSELTLPDGVSGDGFGFALALSGDGSVLVAGADGRDGGNGTVFVFACTGGVCDATPRATLRPPPTPASSVSQLPQHFGRALALSDDGAVLVVGAPQPCCGETGRLSAGFAYVAACGTGGTCSPPTLLTGSGGDTLGSYFGDTVAVSGNGAFIAVGAYGRGSTGVIYTATCGADASCAPLRMFAPPDAQRFDQFGEALVLDGDGSLLFVGAPGRGGDTGVAYVLACVPATGECATEYTLVAADAQAGERFGGCIGVSGDEALAVGTDVGKLYYTLAPSAPASASQSATPSQMSSPPGAGDNGGGPGRGDSHLTPGATAGVAIAAVAVSGGAAILAWLAWTRGWRPPCSRRSSIGGFGGTGGSSRSTQAGAGLIDTAYVAIGKSDS